MTSWLVLIESNTSGTGRLFVRKAIDCGLRPILLASDPARYPYTSEEKGEVLQIDTQNEQLLVQACERLAESGALVGITTSSEYFIVTAARLARHFHLPALYPQIIESCRNKARLCQHLQAAGVPVPRFQEVTSTREAIEAAQRIGFPVVLKPVNGTGSGGVKCCRALHDVEEQATQLLQQRRNERGLPIPHHLLVEEMLCGPEYSVETFGETIIGITHKHLGPLPFFVETGHDYPAQLAVSLTAQIQEVAQKALRALEYRWGPAHAASTAV